MASSGRQYRELYDYAYTVVPNVEVWPLQAPGRNRNAQDFFQGYVTAALGAVVAETQYGITRVRSTDVFDVVASKLHILIPGFYKIRFEIGVTASHDLRIEEVGNAGGILRKAAGTIGAAEVNYVTMEAYLSDATITPANPAILEFNTYLQTENKFGAEESLITVERVGELVAI